MICYQSIADSNVAPTYFMHDGSLLTYELSKYFTGEKIFSFFYAKGFKFNEVH